MLGQLFIISPRGDAIVSRDFRGNATKGLAESFMRQLRLEGNAKAPVITIQDQTVIHIKRNNLYFLLSCGNLDAPLAVWIDLLENFVRIIKDFCGVLDEESARRNFALVHEIVDEVFDYGFMLATRTDDLTDVIRNEATSANASKAPSIFNSQGSYGNSAVAFAQTLANLSVAGLTHLTTRGGNIVARAIVTASSPSHGPSGSGVPRTIPSVASQAPIGANGSSLTSTPSPYNSPDLFIDVMDRVNFELDVTTGDVISCDVNGLLLLKSYLPQEGIELRLGFLDDDTRNSERTRPTHLSNEVAFDDCLFHESVRNAPEFRRTRELVFVPPQGEFVLMRYRVTGKVQPPMAINAQLNVLAKDKLQILCDVTLPQGRKDLSGLMAIEVDLPRWITGGFTQTLSENNSSSVNLKNRKLSWHTRSLELTNGKGRNGFLANLNVDLEAAPPPVKMAMGLAASGVKVTPMTNTINTKSTPTSVIARHLTPLSVTFELPMHSLGGLMIRYLRASGGYPNPQRWVRYLSLSASCIGRF